MLRSESLVESPVTSNVDVTGHRAKDGADGDRTHDLRLAKPALSQLSYSPYAMGNRVVAIRRTSEGRPENPRSGYLGSALVSSAGSSLRTPLRSFG
jgi:hypothetical protein